MKKGWTGYATIDCLAWLFSGELINKINDDRNISLMRLAVVFKKVKNATGQMNTVNEFSFVVIRKRTYCYEYVSFVDFNQAWFCEIVYSLTIKIVCVLCDVFNCQRKKVFAMNIIFWTCLIPYWFPTGH